MEGGMINLVSLMMIVFSPVHLVYLLEMVFAVTSSLLAQRTGTRGTKHTCAVQRTFIASARHRYFRYIIIVHIQIINVCSV